MKYIRLKKEEQVEDSDEILNKWEYNILLSLLILLIMATILDLNISFASIIDIIAH